MSFIRDTDIFSPEYQRKALQMLISTSERKAEPSFVAKVFRYCEPEYFEGIRLSMFKNIKELYQQALVPAVRSAVEDKLRSSMGKDMKTQEIAVAELDLIMGIKIDYAAGEDGYIKGHMENFVKLNKFVRDFKDIAESFNAKKHSETLSKYTSMSQELNNISFKNDNIVLFNDYKEILNIARSQSDNPCKTGLHAIDESLMGGLLPQTWTTFIGPSNTGKSMLTWTLVKTNIALHKKIVVSVHEDEEVPTKLRALSAISGIEYNKLAVRGVLSPEEEQELENAQILLDNYVRIMYMYGRDATIENVHRKLTVLKSEWDFDLYLCDYGQALSSEDFKSRDNEYARQGFIYERLKHICLELNIAGAGGAQTNRSASKVNKGGEDILRATDVGDSFTIVKKSSNVITMNRSDDDIKGGRMFYFLDKARQGRCPVLVQTFTDYGRCLNILPEKQLLMSTNSRPNASSKKEEQGE